MAETTAADDATAALLAAAGGDRVALASFVRATQDEVWRFCAHLVDPQSADDLTQEVYARALTAVPRFRGDASARTWLLSIARRAAADEIRRRRRRRRLPDPTERIETDPSGVTALHALLEELPYDRRVAFVLTQMLGLRYAEAARATGVRVGTIRSRVARARAELIALLEPADDPADDAADDDATGHAAADEPGADRDVADEDASVPLRPGCP